MSWRLCPHCGAVSKQLEWSEKVSEEQVALVWRCTSCGHERETRTQRVVQEPSTVELAQEFLP